MPFRLARSVRVAAAAALFVAARALPGIAAPAAAPIAGYPDFEIVESAPLETSLDHPEIRNASDVWLEMIRGAKRSLDFGEFYATDHPGSRLDEVIAAVADASRRGVKVRFLLDKAFYKNSKETAERMERAFWPGGKPADSSAEGLLTIDWKDATGGIQHAKYFVVDRGEVFLGSQNFDWRALEHIQELGVRIRNTEFAGAMAAVFDADWAAARAKSLDSTSKHLPVPAARFPASIRVDEPGGETLVFAPAISPTGWIPDESAWDEPRLAALIDSAKSDVVAQVLTYKPVSDGEYYDVLEGALRRAAARKVRVRLIVADWCKRESTVPYIKSLALVPGIEVRFMVIPEHSSGFIPFSRVVHAKYLAVDGRSGWIGTSNWEKDYFHSSRNVGVTFDSPKIAGILAAFFEGNWGSPYAEAVKPEAAYTAPRTRE